MKKIVIIILSILVISIGAYIFFESDVGISSDNQDFIIENDKSVEKEDYSNKKEIVETPQENKDIKEIPEDELEKYIRYSSQGPIDIGILYKNVIEPNDEYLIFEMMLNNHSIDVNNIDYSKFVSLRNDKGLVIKEGFEWDVFEGSGHHVFGSLKIPKQYEGENIIDDTTEYIELELKGFEDTIKSEKSKFLWKKEVLRPFK